MQPAMYLREANIHSLKLIRALSQPEVNHYQTAYSSQWIKSNLEAAVFELETQLPISFLKHHSLHRKLNDARSLAKRIGLTDIDYIESFHGGAPDSRDMLQRMQLDASEMRTKTIEITEEISSQVLEFNRRSHV